MSHFWLSAVFICLVGMTAHSSEDTPLRVDAFITADTRGQATADVDLGNLTAGENVEAVVVLSNHLSEDITFSKIITTCGCIQARTLKNKIPQGQSIEMQVQLSIPKDRNAPRQYVVITFPNEEQPESSVLIRLHFSVAGLLRFHDQIAEFTIAEPAQTIVQRIPITITPPIDPKKLQISGTGGFASVKGRVIRRDENDWLQFEITRKDPKQVETTGTIQVHDAHSGRTDGITCVIRRHVPVSIRPTILRPRHVKKDELFEVTAFVRLNPGKVSNVKSKSTIARRNDILVTANIHDVPIEIETEAIGSNVLRATLKIPEQLIAEGATEIRWHVKGNEKNFHTSSRLKY